MNNSHLQVTFRGTLFTALLVDAPISAQLYRKYTLPFHNKVQAALTNVSPLVLMDTSRLWRMTDCQTTDQSVFSIK